MSSNTETGTPLTQEDIEAGLREMGLGRGAAVEVHSSLSSFGWVEGGAGAVVDALMNLVGEEGTLVMSAYPVSKPLPLTEAEKARGILAKVRLYGLDYEGPTGMGAIADEFRRRPGVVLGQGFHRVCAWGREAERHSQGYQYLLAVDGWALLMGVDIGSCSSMHQAEKVGIPDEITRFFRLPEELRRDYPPEEFYLSYGSTPEDSWRKIQAEAERLGIIRQQRIGGALCRLFTARAVVGMYESALRTDPFGLFGVKQA